MNIIKGFAGYGLAGLFLQYVCVLLLFFCLKQAVDTITADYRIYE